MSDEYPNRHRTSIDSFGMVIAKARLRLGWSQSYLGLITGYNQGTISAIERNAVSPNVSTLQDISNALGVEFVISPD